VLGDETPGGAGKTRLYLDGYLGNSVNYISTTWTGDLIIGALTASSVNALWEGGIDEVSLYDYAPSRWEVLEQWNQGNQLSGPPLRLEPPPATAEVTSPAPTIRRSPVRPLNEFFDDFNAPFVDRNKWRDASAGARIINGALVLRANGEKALTQDYFNVRDSSLIVRVDKLPLRQGEVFIGLVNENDIGYDVSNPEFDSFRRHRDIGFKIIRYQQSGRTVTELHFTVYDQTFTGPQIRRGSIAYIPDDPNYPSPMRWLRLDIDAGRSGGATWYTSPDGVNWTDRYDVHGGRANTKVVYENVGGTVVESYETVYEDAESFRLFDNDIVYPEETDWRGYMRVLLQVTNGDGATDARLDNLNVLPQGTGNPVEVIAKHDVVLTSTSTEYLLYAMNPRTYSSAQDVQISAPEAKASVGFLTPPEPVYVYVGPAQSAVDFLTPQRAGDAVPVQIVSVPTNVFVQMRTPASVGQASDKVQEPNQAQAYGTMVPPEYISTDQSSPAPAVAPHKQDITLRTRNVRVLVTQN
jgi:hypothetical protein